MVNPDLLSFIRLGKTLRQSDLVNLLVMANLEGVPANDISEYALTLSRFGFGDIFVEAVQSVLLILQSTDARDDVLEKRLVVV